MSYLKYAYPKENYFTPIEPIQTSLAKERGILICYGYGAELGNFKVYANSLEKIGGSKGRKYRIVKTFTRDDLHSEIVNCPFEINEIHILSHAYGAGLALGYHEASLTQARGLFIHSNPNPTYKQVVNFEKGILFTDHLVGSNFSPSIRAVVRSKLINCSFIKLWGCNSAVENWNYKEGNYWLILNSENIPKLSVAQSLANYTKVKVLGASSGSHPEYKIKGKWISGIDYKKSNTKNYPYPNEYTSIRLHPDRGNYAPFLPQ